MNKQPPYLKKRVSRTIYSYNPEYGDKKVCACGHPYHRHFDPYEDWAAVGCKYCACRKFRLFKCDDPTCVNNS